MQKRGKYVPNDPISRKRGRNYADDLQKRVAAYLSQHCLLLDKLLLRLSELTGISVPVLLLEVLSSDHQGDLISIIQARVDGLLHKMDSSE